MPGDRPLRVLFVHPSYPNTFERVIDALAVRPGLKLACMVDDRYQAAVAAGRPKTTYFSFHADAARAGRTWPGLGGVEHRARVGLGVARAIAALRGRHEFDVIVGSASNGCTLYLREVTDAAIVSFCEQPGYFLQRARTEFPTTLDQYAFDVGYRALVMASVAYSEVGLVGSQHARAMFPPELQPKVRVQSEGCPLGKPVVDRRALRIGLGLPPDAPIVAFFGRTLEAVRGFDVFLQVAQRVKHARPDVRLLVIGSEETRYGNEGAYLGGVSFKRWALQRTAVSESDIIWRDYLPYATFRDMLQCIDVAVLPTFEGASNWSFFDAMACGVAIVASDRSYIPELLQHERDGYLHDPTDIDGFTESVLRLIDSPAERVRIGHNARERIALEHTPERAADGYEHVIREAVALRAGPRLPPSPVVAQPLRLELGCGPDHDPSYFGIDARAFPGVDLVWDLERTPIPLPNGCCDEIVSNQVLEHIQHLVPLMNDCHRLLRPGGLFRACIPQACDARGRWHAPAFQDPTHVRYFVPATWGYFVGDDPLHRFGRLYDIAPWELVSLDEQDWYATVVLRRSAS